MPVSKEAVLRTQNTRGSCFGTALLVETAFTGLLSIFSSKHKKKVGLKKKNGSIMNGPFWGSDLGPIEMEGAGISNERSWSWIVSGGAGVRESVSGICGARGSVSAGSVTWQGRGRDESEKLAQPTNQPNKHQRFY